MNLILLKKKKKKKKKKKQRKVFTHTKNQTKNTLHFPTFPRALCTQ